MSKTHRDRLTDRPYRWEHPSDSWTTSRKEERRARQPQRNRRAFEADLALDGAEEEAA